MEETIRKIDSEFGLNLSEDEIRNIAVQAEAMNRSLRPLFDIDVTHVMPVTKLDRRIEK
jgi:hypothetical protein